MSGTLSTTIVQPLAQVKNRTVNAISNATSSPFGTPKTGISTPKAQPPPSPGTWQHPKLGEITRRQAATRFSSRDAKIASANTILLFLSLYFRSWLHALLSYATSPLNDIHPSPTIASYTLTLLRLYVLLNIALTLRPLSPYLAKTDTLTDIPLTPSQRSLLGLTPSPSPATASTGYITPPRYRRSSGSFTSSSLNSNTSTPTSGRSISANYASSPLSSSRYTLGFSPGTQTPFRTQRTGSGSPFNFSPSASPLLHKAIGRGIDREARLQESTFNGNSNASGFTPGLSRSQSVKERSVRSRDEREPGTPSPGFGGVKRDPGLNYKWLYQTGRGAGGRIPKSESMQF
jgi:nucleoporin POM34